MKIKLIKFRDDLLKPIRKHYNDAGIDCYAQEDITLESCKSVVSRNVYEIDGNGNAISFYNKEIKPISQETTYKIPLGFGIELPTGYVALIKPRSSMNVKGILTFEGVIDAGYKGQISAVFSNLNDEPVYFKRGDRICQIIIVPTILADLVDDLGEERGSGGFGSTGD